MCALIHVHLKVNTCTDVVTIHLYRCHTLMCLCIEVAHISCTAACPHQQLCSHRLIQPCSVRGLFLFPSLPCMTVRDRSSFWVLNEVMLRKLGMLNHVVLPSRFPLCIKSDDLTDYNNSCCFCFCSPCTATKAQ